MSSGRLLIPFWKIGRKARVTFLRLAPCLASTRLPCVSTYGGILLTWWCFLELVNCKWFVRARFEREWWRCWESIKCTGSLRLWPFWRSSWLCCWRIVMIALLTWIRVKCRKLVSIRAVRNEIAKWNGTTWNMGLLVYGFLPPQKLRSRLSPAIRKEET